MKVKFDVVCPEGDDKFSYYPMEVDYRLIKNIALPGSWSGGCMVELITGQAIHACESLSCLRAQRDRCRDADTYLAYTAKEK